MSFDSLGLSAELLRAVADQGYTEPTPIQQRAIPAILEGKDIMAGAQTGTGKPAGFTLPLLQLLHTRPPANGQRPVRALVIAPTRELAAQVQDSIRTYGRHLNLHSAVLFGGVKINPQISQLRRGVDIACLERHDPVIQARTASQVIDVREGIDTAEAKKMVKLLKDRKLKVQAAIQGEQLRVTGKKRDDLQSAIAYLKEQDFGLPLQYKNFRD